MRRYQFILVILVLLVLVFFTIFSIPAQASRLYGPPAARLTISQRIQYSVLLLSYGNQLTTSIQPSAFEQLFTVEEAESVVSVAERLEANGLISKANAFRARYPQWTWLG